MTTIDTIKYNNDDINNTMRLQAYITEGSRSKPIEKEEALNLIKTKCKKMFGSGIKIYRGVDNEDDFLFSDPRKGVERKSANTGNYYTWLMDHLSSWTEYPRRSYSLICATSKSISENFGYPFYVFPFDGAKIGVCSEEDLWGGFPKLKKYGGSDFENLDDFNSYLSDMFTSMDDLLEGGDGTPRVDGPKGYQYHDSWEDFRNGLTKLAIHQDAGLFKSFENLFDSEVPSFWQILQHRKKGEAISLFFDRIMDPKENKFKLVKAGQVNNIPLDREVWTEGPAVLINTRLDVSKFGKEWKNWI